MFPSLHVEETVSVCLSLGACKRMSHLFVYLIQNKAVWHFVLELQKQLNQHWHASAHMRAYMGKNTDAHKAQKTEKALIKFMKVKCS